MTTDRFMDEVRDMRPMLLSVAKGSLDSDEEAEDVVQDAMLRLWQLRSAKSLSEIPRALQEPSSAT